MYRSDGRMCREHLGDRDRDRGAGMLRHAQFQRFQSAQDEES
jgi:hypothetical protein